ncbi:PhzF family phenazine biosynthesis protein [Salinibaculum rarum]|uniref:PhzF family phenazine biosynthesis protein n=1 Tax=Salinibaculum rarum TaxID=3058903 RepID=UPI00265E7978|nr:PhzF family phenazine biosynthesis protein [Salinibaculum sp. KK48]
METRQACLVDACAAEPTGGAPVGVVPDGDGLAEEQVAAVAGEFATTIALPDGDGLRVSGPSGPLDHHPAATIATVGFQHERGDREVGEHTLSTAAGTVETEVTSDGGVWVEQSPPTATPADIEESRVADALGIDPASIRDVGADFPPTLLSVGIDTLVVPVNFLEHLSGARPDAPALSAVADATDADVVCGFTFDTLAADTACHMRAFVPPERSVGGRTVGLETPALPAVAGGLVSHLFERGSIEDATTGVEQGHFIDRPGRVHVEAGGGLRVGGHTVTSLDGTVTVPPVEDDDIIEV